MATNKTKDVSSKSKAHEAMAARLQLVSDLLGGTESMRQAGEVHLPKHLREHKDDYTERLDTNVLHNEFEWTLDNLVSKPFAERPDHDTLTDVLQPLMQDVDLQGNNLAVFLKSWFRSSFADGLGHVLVEYPRVKKVEGVVRTLEDDAKENLRPYWVQVDPRNIWFAFSENEKGAETLKQVRILEESLELDQWVEVVQRRLRVLTPGKVQIYKEVNKKWTLEDEWETGLSVIPLVTYYANEKEGLFCCKPPLLDLAYMCVDHWQSSSNQRTVLTVARFPMLAVSGASSDSLDETEIGPKRLLYTSDPSGKYYYVEHEGKAIEAGQLSLKALEESMKNFGGTLLQATPGTQTATARALDSAEAISPLKAAVLNFEDAVAQVVYFTALWMGLADTDEETLGRIKLHQKFAEELDNKSGLEFLNKSRERKEISRETWITELKRRNILHAEYDPEEDADLISEENEFSGAATFNIDPAQQEEPEPPTPPEESNQETE